MLRVASLGLKIFTPLMLLQYLPRSSSCWQEKLGEDIPLPGETMFTVSTFSRTLRRIHMLRYSEPIDEDLRGWNWDRPPLRPRAYLELGVSEIAYRFCATRRDLWLRRREGIRVEPSEPMRIGMALHNILHRVSNEMVKYMAKGLRVWDAYATIYSKIDRIARECTQGASTPSWVKDFAKGVAFAVASIAMEYGSPPISELAVDGSLLGLSRNLRVDAILHGGVVVELKYGSNREDYSIALAGYALALESFLEVPVDVGVIITIGGNGLEPKVRIDPVHISNSLRQDFIEARDEAIDILLSRSPPPRPSQCHPSCPYAKVCGVEV